MLRVDQLRAIMENPWLCMALHSRNLVLLDSGDVALKSRNETASLCVDSLARLCILIMPTSAWDKANLEASKYSQLYSKNIVMVCMGGK